MRNGRQKARLYLPETKHKFNSINYCFIVNLKKNMSDLQF